MFKEELSLLAQTVDQILLNHVGSEKPPCRNHQAGMSFKNIVSVVLEHTFGIETNKCHFTYHHKERESPQNTYVPPPGAGLNCSLRQLRKFFDAVFFRRVFAAPPCACSGGEQPCTPGRDDDSHTHSTVDLRDCEPDYLLIAERLGIQAGGAEGHAVTGRPSTEGHWEEKPWNRLQRLGSSAGGGWVQEYEESIVRHRLLPIGKA